MYEPGDTLVDGKYEVVRELGTGGCGVVYLVREVLTERLLAVKRVHMGEQESLDQEIKQLAALEGLPHILPILTVEEEKGTRVIVTRYMDGGDLFQYIQQKKRIPESESLAILDQVCQALVHAHKLNIVHKDIKPQNIYAHKGQLDEHTWYLGDWGIAALHETSRTKGSGTVAYCAPEVFHEKRYPASDIYSLGCTLFCMLAGDPPFTGTTGAIIKQHLFDEPKVPSEISREMQGILHSMLRRDPKERPAAGDLLEMVRGLTRGRSTRGQRTGTIDGLGADAFKKPGPDPKWIEERARLVREVQNALSASKLESARAWLERLEAHLGEQKESDSEYGALQEAVNRLSKEQEEEARRKREWEDRREELIEAVETAVNAGNSDQARRSLDLLRKHVSPLDKKGTIWKWFGKSKGSDDRLLRLLSNEVERLEVANREQKAWEEKREQLIGELESALQGKRLQEARRHLEALSRHLGSGVEQDREYRLLKRQVEDLEEEARRKRAEEERKKEEERRQAELRRQAEEKRRAEERRRKEEEEARKRREPARSINNSIGMEFVYIAAGTFMMGSPDSDNMATDKEKPQHKVTLTKGYYLQTTPVTQRQWKAVMGDNPSHFKKGDTYPVENVSWDDCQEFIRKLNQKEGVQLYRLPNEAEWEYACRAGSTTKYCFGDDEGGLAAYAWYEKNSGRETHPVGQKKPNAWGLYDMHGNVWEWCQDWYGDYPTGSVTDPTGHSSGSFRVLRGGCWNNNAWLCRSALRNAISPDYRNFDLGLRVLRSCP